MNTTELLRDFFRSHSTEWFSVGDLVLHNALPFGMNDSDKVRTMCYRLQKERFLFKTDPATRPVLYSFDGNVDEIKPNITMLHNITNNEVANDCPLPRIEPNITEHNITMPRNTDMIRVAYYLLTGRSLRKKVSSVEFTFKDESYPEHILL